MHTSVLRRLARNESAPFSVPTVTNGMATLFRSVRREQGDGAGRRLGVGQAEERELREVVVVRVDAVGGHAPVGEDAMRMS
jgi:hypothetical protein